MRRTVEFTATEGRDAGKKFIITEMSAWDADELASDIYRIMMDTNFTALPADVIAMGVAGLATVGLSVISSASKEAGKLLRDQLMDTVEIEVTHQGNTITRKVKGAVDFEEVFTIRQVLDKVFETNFSDFLKIESA